MIKTYLFAIFVSLFFFSCSNISNDNKIISFEKKGFIGNLKDLKIKNKKLRENWQYLLRWHFIWSKYYYYKKRFGKIKSLIIFIPLMVRTNIKIIFNKLLNNKEKIEKYTTRLDGLMTSIKGKKSSLRP